MDYDTESDEKKEKQAKHLADVSSNLDLQGSGSESPDNFAERVQYEKTIQQKREIIYEEFIEVLGEAKVQEVMEEFYRDKGEGRYAHTWIIKEWTKPKFVSL
jgi:hypothetical protein